jgi:hypothetical protein
MVITDCIINKTMLNIVACLPTYLSVRHSFCSAKIVGQYLMPDVYCCQVSVLIYSTAIVSYPMVQQPLWVRASSLSRHHDHTHTHHTW